MADLNFPTNPNDGDTYVFDGKTYVYNASNDQWKIQTTGSTNVNLASLNASIVPASNNVIDLGSSSKMFADLFVGSSATLPANTTIDDKNAGIGLEVYANTTVLPMSGDVGRLAFVESNKRVYLWNGLVWFHVFNASSTNDAPVITSVEPFGQYYLDGATGSNTVIEIIAQDPEDGSLTFDYDVTSGAIGNTVITQSNNVFTITPSPDVADAGDFELTFSVTDGLNIVNRTSLLTLRFSLDWTNPTFLQYIYGANTDTSSVFGREIGIDGYNLIVGAAEDDGEIATTTTNQGAIYIYNIEDTSNVYQSQVIKGKLEDDISFGNHFEFCSNTLVVACNEVDVGAVDNSGEVYVYRRGSDGLFDLLQTLQQPDASTGKRFGKAFTLSDDGLKLFIGDNGSDDRDMVHYYTRATVQDNFTKQSEFRPSSSQIGQLYNSLSDIGYDNEFNEVILGYPTYPHNTNSYSRFRGCLVVFTFDDNIEQWNQTQFCAPGGVIPYTSSASQDQEYLYVGSHIECRGGYIFTRHDTNNYESNEQIQVLVRVSEGTYSNKGRFWVSSDGDFRGPTVQGIQAWDDGTYIWCAVGRIYDGGTNKGSVNYLRITKSSGSVSAYYANLNGINNENFGYSLGYDPFRGIFAVGAPNNDSTGATNRGRVTLYRA